MSGVASFSERTRVRPAYDAKRLEILLGRADEFGLRDVVQTFARANYDVEVSELTSFQIAMVESSFSYLFAKLDI